MYIRETELVYFSERYKKHITVPAGFKSDGATGAIDIDSDGWWVHDRAIQKGSWDDGTKITTRQESMILYDILRSEGRFIRAVSWGVSTFLFRSFKSLTMWWTGV